MRDKELLAAATLLAVAAVGFVVWGVAERRAGGGPASRESLEESAKSVTGRTFRRALPSGETTGERLARVEKAEAMDVAATRRLIRNWLACEREGRVELAAAYERALGKKDTPEEAFDRELEVADDDGRALIGRLLEEIR